MQKTSSGIRSGRGFLWLWDSILCWMKHAAVSPIESASRFNFKVLFRNTQIDQIKTVVVFNLSTDLTVFKAKNCFLRIPCAGSQQNRLHAISDPLRKRPVGDHPLLNTLDFAPQGRAKKLFFHRSLFHLSHQQYTDQFLVRTNIQRLFVIGSAYPAGTQPHPGEK